MHKTWIVAIGLLAIALSGCTATRQLTDASFKPPQGDFRLVVMRPEVQVAVLTIGGKLEQRQDWTDQGRAAIVAAIEARQAARGGNVKIAGDFADAGGDLNQVVAISRLHDAVGTSILYHQFGEGGRLPTKVGNFDWTLGSEAVEYGRATGFEYALFIHIEDSFSSDGRVAWQTAAAIGCALGVCVATPSGGMQVAFASLVDLKTGQIVWFNSLLSSDGDVRTPAGAKAIIEDLLGTLQLGPAAAAS